MPGFKYKVKDSVGEMLTGEIEAANLEDASNKLRAGGKTIVELKPKTSINNVGRKVKRDDVISFAHQLAVMVETGVPLKEALDVTYDQASNPVFQQVLDQVRQSIDGGADLSSALSKHEKVFPTVMVSLIKASEASGTMGKMLDRIAMYLSKERATRNKVKRALAYPAFMLVFAAGITVALMTFVLPRFATLFASRGAALPAPTRFLMATSELLTTYWYGWILGVAGIVIGTYFFARTDQGRLFFDMLKLKMPVSRGLFTKLYITRACSTMGTMINAGVGMLDMIAIVRTMTENIYYEQLWDKVTDSLESGCQLSDVLNKSELIPREVSQMIYSGEKSGRLGQVLNRLAAYTEEELDDAIKQATQFIEPAMIILMGGIVGFIAMALLLPVFTASTVASGG